LSLVGTLRPVSKGLTLSNETSQKLGENFYLLQTLALSEIEKLIDQDLNSNVLELSELSPASFTSIRQPINLSSYRHFGYAFQWFGLAIVILVGVSLYVLRGRNK
jgi:cytochrome oxidase assembly protein ShyY1